MPAPVASPRPPITFADLQAERPASHAPQPKLTPQDAARRARLLYTCQATVFATLGILIAAGMLLPEAWQDLVFEGMLIQNATFSAFAIASAVGVMAFALRRWHLGRAFVYVPVIAALGFMEEIAWGYRLKPEIEPAMVVMGHPLDSLANLTRVGRALWYEAGLGFNALLVVLGACVVAVRPWIVRHRGRLSQTLDRNPSLTYLTIAFLLIVAAWSIGGIEHATRTLLLCEEFFEFAAAVTLIFAALSGLFASPRRVRTTTQRAPASRFSDMILAEQDTPHPPAPQRAAV